MDENVVLAPEAYVPPFAAPVPVVKLSWAGLFGGIVVAVGLWLLLTALGLAVGLSSVSPSDSMNAMRNLGIGTGIWSLVVSIVALFVGGLVASRTSGILDRPAGAIHGAVLWALATVLSIALVGGIVRNVVRGAFNTAGLALNAVTEQGGPGIGQAMGLGLGTGIDTDDMTTTINERLRAENKPAMTPEQLQSITQSTTLRDGHLDKESFASTVSENTGLSRSGARDAANRVDQQMQSSGPALPSEQDLKTGAIHAADAVGHAMWWVFLGMLLGLVAAVLGSTLGVSRRQRIAAGVAGERHIPVLREAHPVHP
jgi:hypothetical protein